MERKDSFIGSEYNGRRLDLLKTTIRWIAATIGGRVAENGPGGRTLKGVCPF